MSAALQLQALQPGFADPVHEAQQAFRCVLEAMSHPGRVLRMPVALTPPPGLTAASAALLLALADSDTPLWLPPALRQGPAANYLRFHAGCPLVDERGAAQFLLLQDLGKLPAHTALRCGDAEYPDRAATLIVQVSELASPGPIRLRGPGIPGQAEIAVGGWSQATQDFLAENRQRFPLGVDLILCCGQALMGLPRSTRVEG